MNSQHNANMAAGYNMATIQGIGREIDTRFINSIKETATLWSLQLLYEEYLVLAHEAVLAVAYISHSQTIVARERKRERKYEGVHSNYNTTIPSEKSTELVTEQPAAVAVAAMTT